VADDEPQADRFGSALPPPPSYVPPSRSGPAWESRGYSVESFLATARQALLEPSVFFTDMRREGGLGAPLVYGLLGFTLGLVVSAIVQTSLSSMPMMVGMPSELEHMVGNLAFVLAMIALSPFLALFSLFVSSAIYHVMLLLLGGARTFETTFRVVSYSAGSTGLIAVIPFCGGFVSAIWQIVAAIIGLARAHEISTGKAAAAVLLPAIICCFVIMLTIGTIIAMIAAGVGALGRA
jgi:hypothetical protein